MLKIFSLNFNFDSLTFSIEFNFMFLSTEPSSLVGGVSLGSLRVWMISGGPASLSRVETLLWRTSAMEDYVGAGLVQVKTCDTDHDHCVPAPGPADAVVTSVTSVINNNNNNNKFSRCEGCGELILDRFDLSIFTSNFFIKLLIRFVMRLSDSSWHEECLFCSQCHAPLTNSCYHRDGKLFCRIDYER